MTDKTSNAGLLKRGTPSKWPEEFKVADDPSDALFDERWDRSIAEERIRNFIIVGQVEPIVVRLDGDDLVIVAGRQRWKRAVVVNHLAGVRLYKGRLRSVLEAIKAFQGTDLAKLAGDRCSAGVKLTFVLRRGDEADAAGAMVSENEQRDDDELSVKIARAQRMARGGHTPADLATYFGKSEATINRWLDIDTKAPREKKTRGPSVMPSRKRIAAVLDNGAAEDELSPRERLLLAFAVKGLAADGFKEAFPKLSAALAK